MKRRITAREFEAAKQKLVTTAQVLEASNNALKDHVGLIIEIAEEIRGQVESAKRANARMVRFIDNAVPGKARYGQAADVTLLKKNFWHLKR